MPNGRYLSASQASAQKCEDKEERDYYSPRSTPIITRAAFDNVLSL